MIGDVLIRIVCRIDRIVGDVLIKIGIVLGSDQIGGHELAELGVIVASPVLGEPRLRIELRPVWPDTRPGRLTSDARSPCGE